MKILIKKEFAGYKPNTIIEIDENNPHYYTDVAYWLRRCEDGKIDGYCELIEFNNTETEKEKSVIQSRKEGTRKNKYKIVKGE